MIKLGLPDIGEEELEEIKKVIDSKHLVHGDRVEELESLIRKYLNVKHAIAVSSGTAALHLALAALDIGVGDEVIIPDFTFPATSNVVELLGATSVFVDITLDSFCIDTRKVEDKITRNTKAILPVHEFGHCADMDRIIKLAQKYDLKVIEDAACALGATYKGEMAGTIGDIGCFSLHPRKAITTGEGGILVTNNDMLAEKLIILRNHGISYINGKPKFVSAGFNYRLTNIQGAIGTVQMKKLSRINAKREDIAKKYDELLRDIEGITLPIELSYGRHVWQTYHILLDKGQNREEIIQQLKNRNIESNFGAYAVHEQPYYKTKYNYGDGNYINSSYAYRCGLALPMHSGLENKDIVYIKESLNQVLGG
jgi:dTDP-4-amino-4,6-dideoxygalactose transaminase